MQDWLYHKTGALHLDLVISHYLKPLPQDLPTYWRQNRQAIISLLRTVHASGVRGCVVDKETGAGLVDASVRIYDLNDRAHQLHPAQPSGTKGGFARFLVPGRYRMQVEAEGYRSSDPYFFTINTSSQRTFTAHVQLRAEHRRQK